MPIIYVKIVMKDSAINDLSLDALTKSIRYTSFILEHQIFYFHF